MRAAAAAAAEHTHISSLPRTARMQSISPLSLPSLRLQALVKDVHRYQLIVIRLDV